MAKAILDPITRHLLDNAGHHGPLALMYHSVQKVDRTPSSPWAVSRKQFQNHLDLLQGEGWTTCTIHQLLSRHAEDPGRTIVITFDDGFLDNLWAAEMLERRGMRASWFVVTGSVGKTPSWEDTGRPSGRMLDRTDLRTIAGAGMEIGSHSQSHLRLPTLGDQALRDEVSGSKATLEEMLGSTVRSFSYPYGDWDSRCEAIVRLAGYKAACTTSTGMAMKDKDPLRIRRLTICNTDDTRRFARKLGLASNDGGWGPALRYVGRRIMARAGLR